MAGDLSFVNETRAFARFIIEDKPEAKIGILYQNDDYGKDHITGLKSGLGDKAASMIVAEVPYESTDPTVDSQIVALKASGADVLVEASLPKFAAQSIRKVYDIGWKPLHIVSFPAASIPLTLQPAGLDKSAGLVTAAFLKEPGDPTWKDDPRGRRLRRVLEEIQPGSRSQRLGQRHRLLPCRGSGSSVDRLRRRADARKPDVSGHAHGPRARADAVAGHHLRYQPDRLFKQMQLRRFDVTRWVGFGGIVNR